MIHPLRQVQHVYRDYTGMKAEPTRKSESSRDVDLAFQSLVSEATTDTLPNTPNPKQRCQAYLAIRFSAAAVFCSAKLNQSSHFSSACADLKPVATHEHIRHPCPSGCQGWNLGQGPFHWSERQGQLHTSRAVFGNYIPKGCVLKLSFHLP